MLRARVSAACPQRFQRCGSPFPPADPFGCGLPPSSVARPAPTPRRPSPIASFAFAREDVGCVLLLCRVGRTRVPSQADPLPHPPTARFGGDDEVSQAPGESSHGHALLSDPGRPTAPGQVRRCRCCLPLLSKRRPPATPPIPILIPKTSPLTVPRARRTPNVRRSVAPVPGIKRVRAVGRLPLRLVRPWRSTASKGAEQRANTRRPQAAAAPRYA